MLTVKLVEDNGHQQIHEAGSVWADDHGNKRFTVYATKAGAPEELLKFEGSGNVYVMNDKGQTVSKYFLGYGDADHEVATPKAA